MDAALLWLPRTRAETAAVIDQAFREQRTWVPGRGADDDSDFFVAEEGFTPKRRVNASTSVGAWRRDRMATGH